MKMMYKCSNDCNCLIGIEPRIPIFRTNPLANCAIPSSNSTYLYLIVFFCGAILDSNLTEFSAVRGNFSSAESDPL